MYLKDLRRSCILSFLLQQTASSLEKLAPLASCTLHDTRKLNVVESRTNDRFWSDRALRYNPVMQSCAEVARNPSSPMVLAISARSAMLCPPTRAACAYSAAAPQKPPTEYADAVRVGRQSIAERTETARNLRRTGILCYISEQFHHRVIMFGAITPGPRICFRFHNVQLPRVMQGTRS